MVLHEKLWEKLKEAILEAKTGGQQNWRPLVKQKKQAHVKWQITGEYEDRKQYIRLNKETKREF